MGRGTRWTRRALTLAVAVPLALAGTAAAQTPEVLDPDLAVRPAVTGLTQPVSMAFLGDDDFLVLEKASGQVKRVRDGDVEHGARPRRQLELGARPAEHRAAPEVQEERLGLPVLEPEQDRRRHQHR